MTQLTASTALDSGTPTAPLDGLRVIDISSYVAGPSGGMTLAQLGADVIRVDPLGGAPDMHRLPVDPADVRKVALEEDIPVDSDKVKILRERLFGSWEMNWVGFNYARDFTLPGQQDGPIGFLMYPYAETAEGVKDSLDPDAFAYTITSNEIV